MFLVKKGCWCWCWWFQRVHNGVQVRCPLTDEGKARAFFLKEERSGEWGVGFFCLWSMNTPCEAKNRIKYVSNINTPKYFPYTYRISDLTYLLLIKNKYQMHFWSGHVGPSKKKASNLSQSKLGSIFKKPIAPTQN